MFTEERQGPPRFWSGLVPTCFGSRPARQLGLTGDRFLEVDGVSDTVAVEGPLAETDSLRETRDGGAPLEMRVEDKVRHG